jgi:hypothetical protein
MTALECGEGGGGVGRLGMGAEHHCGENGGACGVSFV